MRLGEIPSARASWAWVSAKPARNSSARISPGATGANSSCCSIPMSVSRSVVVDDLNAVCVTLDPLEDHPPLIIDTNRVVPLQISMQLLESVRWRHQQIIKAGSGI